MRNWDLPASFAGREALKFHIHSQGDNDEKTPGTAKAMGEEGRNDRIIDKQ